MPITIHTPISIPNPRLRPSLLLFTRHRHPFPAVSFQIVLLTCHLVPNRALPLGPKRDHFLSLATEEAIAKMKEHKPELFEAAAYDKPWAVIMNYLPSAAWTWAVCDKEAAPLITYNDV